MVRLLVRSLDALLFRVRRFLALVAGPSSLSFTAFPVCSVARRTHEKDSMDVHDEPDDVERHSLDAISRLDDKKLWLVVQLCGVLFLINAPRRGGRFSYKRPGTCSLIPSPSIDSIGTSSRSFLLHPILLFAVKPPPCMAFS